MTRRIRLGMVGGGQGGFIGGAHRIAARLDDEYELLAGALSSDPQRARESGAALHLAPDRCYTDFHEMARQEARRPDGIDAVAIVTPNHLHHAVAMAFLEQGIHVICEKPLATSLAEARQLAQRTRETNLLFAVTHTYSGYPMAHCARELVASGALGQIRVVQVEYAQDWLAEPLEETGNKQADWRADPQRAGPAGALGDIGSHAFHLARFISGLDVVEVAAELTTFVPGRKLDDNVHAMLRFSQGARGMLWASQVASGNHNRLQLRIYGSKAGLHFDQENPEQLWFTPLGQPAQCIRRGTPQAGVAAGWASRVPAGHPEGFLEAFAQLYRDFAAQLRARLDGTQPDPRVLWVPTVEDGCRGIGFIDAVLRSQTQGGAWITLD